MAHRHVKYVLFESGDQDFKLTFLLGSIGSLRLQEVNGNQKVTLKNQWYIWKVSLITEYSS